MTETKATYKLYQLSDRLQELEDTIENLEGVDIPSNLQCDSFQPKSKSLD